MTNIKKPQFEIDSSIVFQLGKDLITDEGQALLELIKNCYDADSEYANVVISTKDNPPEFSEFPKAKGYILVEDNGFGMTKEIIHDGWISLEHRSHDIKSS